jgi:hypothetical protein
MKLTEADVVDLLLVAYGFVIIAAVLWAVTRFL